MIKLSKQHSIFLLFIFLVLTTVGIIISSFSRQSELKNRKEKSYLNAKIYSERLQQDLQRGFDLTSNLKHMLIDNNGTINNFDQIAEDMMEDFISSIQLAPAGVVTQIHPLKGNEAGLGDLMSNATRGPILKYGMAKNVATMQGPFKLFQGGMGIAIRTPVFLDDNDRDTSFWGFTVVIIKYPEIYQATLNSLQSFGYEYSLDATESPLSDNMLHISASIPNIERFSDAQTETFSLGECTWQLTVSSSKQHLGNRFKFIIFIEIISVFLITLLSYLLFRLSEQKEEYNILANYDVLTGLYNRRGFMHRLDELFAESHRWISAIFIDMDDFKSINDVNGHAAGDLAIKHLADELTRFFPDNAIIGRTGGDEFCIVIKDKTPDTVEELVKNAVTAIHFFDLNKNTCCFFTISAGFADYPLQANSRTKLMINADEALYAAKADGKNNVKHYKPSMSDIKRTQLGFNLSSFLKGIPGALLVYKAADDEHLLYANEDMFKLAECKDFSELLEYTGGSFKNMVHKEDLDRVETSEVKKINQDNFIEYRILTKTGTYITVQDMSRLVHDDNYGSIFFVYLREKGCII